MRFEGICPRCRSEVNIEVTHSNYGIDRSLSTVDQETLDEEFDRGEIREGGPFDDTEEEYTGEDIDEIIVQCPMCNTLVRAKWTSAQDTRSL